MTIVPSRGPNNRLSDQFRFLQNVTGLIGQQLDFVTNPETGAHGTVFLVYGPPSFSALRQEMRDKGLHETLEIISNINHASEIGKRW